jgi:hypothetical protein
VGAFSGRQITTSAALRSEGCWCNAGGRRDPGGLISKFGRVRSTPLVHRWADHGVAGLCVSSGRQFTPEGNERTLTLDDPVSQLGTAGDKPSGASFDVPSEVGIRGDLARMD